MKSRISIEVDFENGNQPVIQIMQMFSDDVRDKLLQSFTQKFDGSSWCQIKWVGSNQANANSNEDSFNRIFISPIKPEDFAEQAKVMLEQHVANEKWQQELKEKTFVPQT